MQGGVRGWQTGIASDSVGALPFVDGVHARCYPALASPRLVIRSQACRAVVICRLTPGAAGVTLELVARLAEHVAKQP
jgi:hypothetical protein